MRKLRVMHDDTPEKQELQRRIALSNRPRLDVTQKRLDEVSTALAKSSDDRTRFIQDPTAYLQSQSLPVSSCDFAKTNGVAQTSEICTMMILLNCFVTMETQTSIYVYVRVYVAVIGYEMDRTLGVASNFDYLHQGAGVL